MKFILTIFSSVIALVRLIVCHTCDYTNITELKVILSMFDAFSLFF